MSLERFNIDPNGDPKEQFPRVCRVLQALVNNPHLLVGSENSEIIFPPPVPIVTTRKPGITSSSSSGSSGTGGSDSGGSPGGGDPSDSSDDSSGSDGSSSSSSGDGGPCAPTLDIVAQVITPPCWLTGTPAPFEAWIAYTVTIGPKPEACECESNDVAMTMSIAGRLMPSRTLAYDSEYQGYELFFLPSATADFVVKAWASGVVSLPFDTPECAWQVSETIMVTPPGYCDP